MTTTETLKYAFGETPEDVIRERWNLHAATHEPERSDDLTADWVASFPSFDAFMTVLDALRSQSETAAILGKREKIARPRALRIEILAALGIEEG